LLRIAIVCVVGLGMDQPVCRLIAQAVPEADRYIKLGMRIPELPAGEGGVLHVIAEEYWCRDANYILELRLVSFSEVRPVVRLLAGPSKCDWVFANMPAGQYDVLIVTAGDNQIVANGRGELSKAYTTVILAIAARTHIEGRLRSEQAVPSPIRLNFIVGGSYQWTAPVALDGSYRVTVGDVSERTTLAIYAEANGPPGSDATTALNTVLLKMTTISEGDSRIDLDDVILPPVVVHVDVPPIADAGFGQFAEVRLDNERAPGFKLLRGLRGQFLTSYGEHAITVWSNDGKHMLASRILNVSAPETEMLVVLEIPRK